MMIGVGHAMRFVPKALALAALLALCALPGQAQAREALLMEGKQALHQRVITKASADLVDGSGPGAQVVQADLAPMSIFYVYARENGMVEVGANASGETSGWIAAEETVDWHQSIVVEFNNRANAQRDRILFFDSRDALDGMLNAPDFETRIAEARAGTLAGQSGDTGVIAVEPELYIDIESNFYLLPILQYEEAFLPFGQIGNYLEVASLSAHPAEPEEIADFRTGVVFVIDTTMSMQPYIDQTRRAVERIQQVLAASDEGENLRFGLVGYRQAIALNPGVDYHVKEFLKLSDTATADVFLEQISDLQAARLPTRGFDEDAIGGVYDAIQNMDWDGFQARYIIVISDAGPLAAGTDGNFAADIGVEQIASLAEQKKIRLIGIHLKTPAAPDDHAYAETAYRTMTMRDGQSAYLDIAGGKADAFAPEIDAMASQVVANLTAVREARPIEPVNDTEGARLMARAGRAMELEYLGTTEGERAPDFFKAWTSDMATENPTIRALDVRLMVTRNQLSSLSTALRSIVEAAEGSLALSDPLAFFQQAQELAARASNDTRQIGDDTPLGEVMGEYLDGLPYRSPVLSLTSQDWVTMGRASQRDLLLALKSKLALYERIHNNPDKWIKLYPSAQEGESVTTIPLYQLP